MYRITQKVALNPTVTKLSIEAPLIAQKAQPGQFIIVRPMEDSERIPLTIAGYDRQAGTVDIIFQIVGDTTIELNALNVGDEVKADVFAEGDRVDVTGISKGHGYQGVIKRHGAHRLKESHGTGPVHRHAGSMGPATDPSRIFKGKIGAGQMGNEQVTVLNLDVVKVDTELGLIAVRGAIPGPKGGIVTVRNSVINVKEKGAAAGISSNPQKASARVNPQKASARNK